VIILIIMISYLLRNVDESVWRAAKARAAIEGRPMREILIDAIREYGSAKDQLSKGPRKAARTK
jgi:plasmid stability protein